MIFAYYSESEIPQERSKVMNFYKRSYQLILRYLYSETIKRRGEISLHRLFKHIGYSQHLWIVTTSNWSADDVTFLPTICLLLHSKDIAFNSNITSLIQFFQFPSSRYSTLFDIRILRNVCMTSLHVHNIDKITDFVAYNNKKLLKLHQLYWGKIPLFAWSLHFCVEYVDHVAN